MPLEIGAFRRGDCNDDGKCDIADAVWMVSELFGEGPPTRCREAADCNDDGVQDISDVIHSIGYQFLGTPPPPPPYPDCGIDPDSTPESCPGGAMTACW